MMPATTSKRWGIVYDTGCGTHICNTKQGLRGERKLKQGTLYLCVGNGVRAQVEAIGSDDLVLPNGLVICLDNCHYAPTITRGVVLVSRLVDNGFIQCFTDYEILVSKNYVLYFNAIPSDGIYEIDMLNLVPNVNFIYNDNGFITFTDDYSRYGYVYLPKHRGGEYITQEFKDYLKACGIVQQLTPPYTPQHNGVSERRNRYPKETMGYYFYFPPENKIVVARYAEFLEKNLISQEVSGRAKELEEIQDKDTSPSENTSEIPI
ncbi:retrotransposon protein, putative, ty1-copia subclass [Tanacetum coccineum]